MSRKSFCYKTLETYDKPRDQLKSFCRDGGNSGYYNISSTRGICNDDGDCRVKENFQSGNQPASKNLCQPIAYDDSKGSKCKSGVCKNCCGKWTDDDPALARTFCDLCLNAPLPPVSTRTAAPCQWTDYTCGSESADVPALEGERCDHVKPKMPPSVCRISNDKVSLRCMTPSVCRGGAAYDPSGCGWSGGTPPPTQENFQPIPATAWQQPASVRGTWDQVEGLYELNPQSNSCVGWRGGNQEGYEAGLRKNDLKTCIKAGSSIPKNECKINVPNPFGYGVSRLCCHKPELGPCCQVRDDDAVCIHKCPSPP